MEPVSVRYTTSDYRALAWHCRACRKRLIFFLFLPVMVIFFDEFVVSGTRDIDALTILVALSLGGLISGAFLVILPPLQVRAQRKAGFIEPYRFSLDDEGVRADHPRQDNLYRWGGLHRVAAAGGRLFIYLNPSCALILPKRCFPTESSFEQWRREAEARLAAAKAAT